ncbi:MAG TPA: methyltransferase domain-containing protein [Vicinamibacterales bacterium]
MTLFVSSFLVLFLEIALIRWMPAYIRLLAYFSNFILLATFLGAGLGCLLAARRRNLFVWFPLVQLLVVVAVDRLRLEVAVPSTSSIYFSSGTAGPVVAVESTLLLPVLFVIVAALFTTVAQRMGRELAARRPLEAYGLNLAGSLAGVAAFAIMSWLQQPPSMWFALAAIAALPFVVEGRRWIAAANIALLAITILVVYQMGAGSLWSPYYRITVFDDGADTVVEVNNIFHQSMAPVDRKEYFYQWPYQVFGDRFDDVLILGAGTGTDVAAALRHGAQHVDAVEIDPVILRLGRERHPDRPYADPRVTAVTDDARHFLATTDRKYDLIVFALIDSLTVQSSFSGVRLESYMFTEESFRAVRDHLKPHGAMALYNYFREKWLVDRLANTVASAFGHDPLAYVHQERAYLAVMLAGPRVAELAAPPPAPNLVLAYGQSHEPSPGRPLVRDASVAPATDDWPFLYMRERSIPRHYLAALGVVVTVSLAVWFLALLTNPRSEIRNPTWLYFLLGMGFMLLETKSIVQFALLWGSTWSSASLAIASVLVMALASVAITSKTRLARRWPVAFALLALLAVNYVLPVGRVSFSSRLAESVFYGMLVFSPVLCAGLLFSSAFRTSTSTTADFGANLLGAMAGGVTEYLSLLAGYRFLLLLVGASYLLAVVVGRRR